MSQSARVFWVLYAVASGVFSFFAGIVTYVSFSDSCNWVDRSAPLIYLAIAGVIVTVFFLIHRRFLSAQDETSDRTFTLSILLFVPWLFVMLIVGPNLFGAIDRGRQKRTMSDMRRIGNVMESTRESSGHYPTIESIKELEAISGTELLTEDAWGNPLQFEVSENGYIIASPGKCGHFKGFTISKCPEMQTIDFTEDIVYINGVFVRWPEGTQAN